jgi:enoyl-CoA hydratase
MVEGVEDILFHELTGYGGSLGLITLNKPSTLNSLTMDMCIAIDDKLAEWEKMGHIKAIVIRGEGERAFCAGGNIRFIYDQGRSGVKRSRQFFWHEYKMNRRIFHLSKPYIALMHGITMGGGIGISIHGSHRIGAENLLFAMPETGIGFFPDIGASYFLPRCTGKTGIYLGLTGAKLHIADALYAGVVDHLVPKNEFNNLITALTETRFTENASMQVSDIINSFSMDVDSMDIHKPHLLEHRAEINQIFAADSIEAMLNALLDINNDWCRTTLAELLKKSPTSLKVTLRQLLEGSQMDFDDCMCMEYRITQRFLTHPDFYEGIRAAIIDKDRSPVWRPNNLESISAETVNKYFEPVKQELSFDNKKVYTRIPDF